MSVAVGVIKTITGTVTAHAENGSSRVLQIGDTVYQNEVINTIGLAAVEIDFFDGTVFDMGRNDEFFLDPLIISIPDISSPIDVNADKNVQTVIESILSGQDPTKIEEATSAAAELENEGNEGASTMAHIDYLTPETIPESGFNTLPLNFAFPPNSDDTQSPIQSTSSFINGLSTTEQNPTSYLDDDTLNGIAGGIADNAPDNQNITGILSHDFGTDGQGSLLFTATGAPTGFVYSLSDTGTILTISQAGQDILEIALTDTTSGIYNITQLRGVSHLVGSDENNQIFNITYQVTDGNGDIADGLLKINVDDDTALAASDTNNIIEGDTLTVDAASGVLTNDLFGADVPATAAVSGVAAGNNTATALSTGVASAIAGAHGILTLAADGSYTYQATSNNITADMQDTFVYTIVDNDGDTSTVTLTIDVANVTLSPDNVTAIADEDGLVNATGSETVTGQLAVAGTGVTYNLDSNATGNNGTLTFNNNGSFSYSLTSPVASGAVQGTNTVNGVEVFNYTATDANGNTTQGTITIDVVDDVTTINSTPLTTTSTPTILLQESFENLLTGQPDGTGAEVFLGQNTYTGDHGTVWTINPVAGLEAEKRTDLVSTASDGDVHLDFTGDSILTSSVTISEPNISLNFDFKPQNSGGGWMNMSVWVDGREVTIDPVNGPPLTTLVITTPDGITASQVYNPTTEWINVNLDVTDLTPGQVVTLMFEGTGTNPNEGPLLDNITLTGSESLLSVDEAMPDISATHDFSANFTGDYGADGFGQYLLLINNSTTGLKSTIGEDITLSLNTVTGDIEGRTSALDPIFTISVDNAGMVTLKLDSGGTIFHSNNNSTDSIIKLPAGLISLAVTDADGDIASAQLDISETISFRDDAPIIDAISLSTVLLQESFENLLTGQPDGTGAEVFLGQNTYTGDHGTVWTINPVAGLEAEKRTDLVSTASDGDVHLDFTGDSILTTAVTVSESNISLNFDFKPQNSGGAWMNMSVWVDGREVTIDPVNGPPLTTLVITTPDGISASQVYNSSTGWINVTLDVADLTPGQDVTLMFEGTGTNRNEGPLLDNIALTETPSIVDVHETTAAILSVSHNLDIDIGADAADSNIDLFLENVNIFGDLTSEGEAIAFEAKDTDNDGHNDQIVGATTSGGDVLVINDILNSNPEVELFGSVTSSNTTGHDVEISVQVTATDGDGDRALAILNVDLNFEQVIATPPPVV